MKVFVSGLLLCFVFVLFQSSEASARRVHKHQRVFYSHAHVHVAKREAKLKKKLRVRSRRVHTHRTIMYRATEPDLCLFLCQGGLSSDVATYGAPSPWKAMQRKNAITFRGNVDVGPRPSAWCGWWLQMYTGVTSGITRLNLNRAVEWARVGHPTTPQIGAIVVWRHHVGKITGVAANGRFLVMSGNSGGRRGHRTVTEHARSLRGAIAFRALY